MARKAVKRFLRNRVLLTILQRALSELSLEVVRSVSTNPDVVALR